MPNPGPANTQTQEAIAAIGNCNKFGVFPLTSIMPAAVAAATCAAQNFANTSIGLQVGDQVSVAYQGAQMAGVGVLDAYVSAPDQLTVRFVNPTAGALTPAAASAAAPYVVTVFRPLLNTGTVSVSPQLSW